MKLNFLTWVSAALVLGAIIAIPSPPSVQHIRIEVGYLSGLKPPSRTLHVYRGGVVWPTVSRGSWTLSDKYPLTFDYGGGVRAQPYEGEQPQLPQLDECTKAEFIPNRHQWRDRWDVVLQVTSDNPEYAYWILNSLRQFYANVIYPPHPDYTDRIAFLDRKIRRAKSRPPPPRPNQHTDIWDPESNPPLERLQRIRTHLVTEQTNSNKEAASRANRFFRITDSNSPYIVGPLRTKKLRH